MSVSCFSLTLAPTCSVTLSRPHKQIHSKRPEIISHSTIPFPEASVYNCFTLCCLAFEGKYSVNGVLCFFSEVMTIVLYYNIAIRDHFGQWLVLRWFEIEIDRKDFAPICWTTGEI